LTAQEQRILTLVGRGYSNKLVAEALDLSQQTVKNYVHTIMRKLDAHNRAHAVTIALQRRWLRMEALAVGATQKEQPRWE
jgi:DNA-binding NarL/FixJ family response regulator